MASLSEEIKFTLKVMVNKEKTKVLFADLGSDFADVLLSFLTLPLGTIVRLLQKHYGDQAPVLGSLNSLYNSLANLGNDHFWTEAGKLMLLNPRSSFEAECRKLKLNIDDTQPTKYFACEDSLYSYHWCSQISMYYGAGRCESSGKQMNREIGITKSNIQNDLDGVFTMKSVSFFISDDLKMVPNVPGSFFQSLSNFGITDIDGAEQRNVIIGFNEIMDLLKGSLLSNNPLTDLILHKTQKDHSTINFEVAHHTKKEETQTSNSEKMIVKILVQKSTNRFLFAQAHEDFVDFLLSFLAIPLGGVEWLMGGNSSLRNIDRLYNSSGDLIKYLKSQAAENSVFNPKLAPMYLSKNLIFPLSEQQVPDLYHDGKSQLKPSSSSLRLDIIDPKGKVSYVRGPGMYIVRDDLTVTPLCMSASVSILNEMKIKLSDVKELEVHIGIEEGLSILKASLTSTCALSNGLSSFLMKQPKQENRV